MSYETVIQGLEERLRTVAGIQLIDYEPTNIEPIVVVSTLADFVRRQEGQLTVMIYRTLHTLTIRWQDNAQAERQLRGFVNSIPSAIDQDAHLGGRLSAGIARIIEGRADFAVVGGVKYRVLDFISEVVEKAPYKGGV